MLDVHPPHEAAHSWRDFFIHIATIVVGLLIAIGLEQMVEHIHHRHQVREAEEALESERRENIKVLHHNVSLQRVGTAYLQNDIVVFLYLQKHPGTKAEDLPGVLRWGVPYEPFSTDAWTRVVQANLTGSMDPEKTAENHTLYELMTSFMQQGYMQTLAELNKAGAYRYTQPDVSKLQPAEIAEILEALQGAMREQYVTWMYLDSITRSFPDFAPGPTKEELAAMQSTVDEQKLYPRAFAQTQQKIETAKAYDRAHNPDPDK